MKRDSGFTLVEILVVVIIIGLLSGVAVIRVGDSKDRAVVSVKTAIATDINKAIQMAYITGSVLADSFVVAAAGNADGTAAVVSVLRALQNDPSNAANWAGGVLPVGFSRPFVNSSFIEMIRVIEGNEDIGSWNVTGTSHRNLQVIFIRPPD